MKNEDKTQASFCGRRVLGPTRAIVLEKGVIELEALALTD